MQNKEFSIGKLKEAEFTKLFSSSTPSSKEEDMYEHWDIKIDTKIDTKIDIKSLKKENRSDLTYNENFHYVEIKNVNNDLGWLYGKADYFAFELENYWLIVDKTRLQDFIKEKCKGKKIGNKKDLYALYRRENRKDIIVKVKTIDLMFLSNQIIQK